MSNIQNGGQVPIDSKVGNEQASVGKMQIKGITVATFHGSPPSGTRHTKSVENKYTYLDTQQVHHEPRGGWEGANQRISNKATQSKTTRTKTTRQRHDYACPQRSSAGEQWFSQLTLADYC